MFSLATVFFAAVFLTAGFSTAAFLAEVFGATAIADPCYVGDAACAVGGSAPTASFRTSAAQGRSEVLRRRRYLVDLHLLSIGHGTLDAATFNTHLRAAGVTSAADVRRFPGSRTNPQFGDEPLAASLRAAGIEYRGMPELGGRRTTTPESPNTALRNASFRGYADFMQTPEFTTALTDLLMLAHDRPTAMFCAETLWWRCHRRLIADAVVLLHGGSVTHLVGAMKAAHVLTPGVRRDGTRLVYDNGV
jgi:hypothetical protein